MRFGNGKLVDIKSLKEKILYNTSVLSLYLNLVSTGIVGNIERQMEEAGGDLKDVKRAINSLTAQLIIVPGREGSILTTYTNDDKAVWKDFRRGLVKKGFSSSCLRKNKRTIQAYLEELAARGVLDEREIVQGYTHEDPRPEDSSRSEPPDTDVTEIDKKTADCVADKEQSEVLVKEQRPELPGTPKALSVSAPSIKNVKSPPKPAVETDTESDAQSAHRPEERGDWISDNEHTDSGASFPHEASEPNLSHPLTSGPKSIDIGNSLDFETLALDTLAHHARGSEFSIADGCPTSPLSESLQPLEYKRSSEWASTKSSSIEEIPDCINDQRRWTMFSVDWSWRINGTVMPWIYQ